MCYAAVWQHVIGSRTQHSEQFTYHTYDTLPIHTPYSRTQHSEQFTYHTYDMLPHHHITYNGVVFFCRILT